VTTDELERQIDRLPHDLRRDLGDAVPAERIGAVSRAHYDMLRRDAVINDFIPLLVYRFAKEELVASTRDALSDAA
jgi:hypothetical protein